MTGDARDVGPERTAVRVALWRALHMQVDPPPPVIDDGVGLKLVTSNEGDRTDGLRPSSSEQILVATT